MLSVGEEDILLAFFDLYPIAECWWTHPPFEPPSSKTRVPWSPSLGLPTPTQTLSHCYSAEDDQKDLKPLGIMGVWALRLEMNLGMWDSPHAMLRPNDYGHDMMVNAHFRLFCPHPSSVHSGALRKLAETFTRKMSAVEEDPDGLCDLVCWVGSGLRQCVACDTFSEKHWCLVHTRVVGEHLLSVLPAVLTHEILHLL